MSPPIFSSLHPHLNIPTPISLSQSNIPPVSQPQYLHSNIHTPVAPSQYPHPNVHNLLFPYPCPNILTSISQPNVISLYPLSSLLTPILSHPHLRISYPGASILISLPHILTPTSSSKHCHILTLISPSQYHPLILSSCTPQVCSRLHRGPHCAGPDLYPAGLSIPACSPCPPTAHGGATGQCGHIAVPGQWGAPPVLPLVPGGWAAPAQ